MFGLGGGEVVLILIIALVFLGPKKLPELAQGLGRAFREFQKAKNDFSQQLQEQIKSDEEKSKVANSDEAPKLVASVEELETEKKS